MKGMNVRGRDWDFTRAAAARLLLGGAWYLEANYNCAYNPLLSPQTPPMWVIIGLEVQ